MYRGTFYCIIARLITSFLIQSSRITWFLPLDSLRISGEYTQPPGLEEILFQTLQQPPFNGNIFVHQGNIIHICFAILIKLTGSQQLLLSTKSPKPGVSTYALINWIKCDYFWFCSCFSGTFLTGTTSKII